MSSLVTISLNNVKYALTREGGGWTHVHDLFIILNTGEVYYTTTFSGPEVTPDSTIQAKLIGTIDKDKEFKIPKDLHLCVFDAPECSVYDKNLEDSIYRAFGMEQEFIDYFCDIICLKDKERCIR